MNQAFQDQQEDAKHPLPHSEDDGTPRMTALSGDAPERAPASKAAPTTDATRNEPYTAAP